MASVDWKTWFHHNRLLALGSLFWTLVFWLAFVTNWRYALNDKMIIALSLSAWLGLGALVWHQKHGSLAQKIHRVVVGLSPALILFGNIFSDAQPSNFIIWVFDAWLLVFSVVTTHLLVTSHTESLVFPHWKDITQWKFTLRSTHILVSLATVFFFLTGAYHIGRQAIVDEALWTYDRIPKYFHNLVDGNFYNARISDKPGVTVAYTSGIALATYIPDKNLKNSYDPHAIDMYRAFRLPILLVAALLIPFLFVFIARATNEAVGILTAVFIATLPTLVGVSRIINPDALLWGFFALAFFAYLAFLKEKNVVDLVWSGVFFGLALLTKYVSNFLIVYLLGFMPFLFHHTSLQAAALREALFNRLREIATVLLIGSLLFFVFYPATWVQPDRILKATFLSEAYSAVTTPLAIAFFLFLIDTVLFKSALFMFCVKQIQIYRTFLIRIIGLVFLTCITLLLSSVWLHFPDISFPDLLSSPKSSYRTTTLLPFYLANFYPLFFGVSPLVVLGTIIAVVALITRRIHDTALAQGVLAVILFMLTYYAGATASHVLSITRYQIVLYPLLAFLAAAGWYICYLWWRARVPQAAKIPWIVITLLFFIIGGRETVLSYPHFTSYNSPLLPVSLITEYKDMGDGMYETAAYLNTLPDAKHLTIYTDRAPLCRFFVGKCINNFGDIGKRLKPTTEHYDYIVVTMNRSRFVHRFIDPHLTEPNPSPRLVRYDRAYDFENPDMTIVIGNRPSQSIKIIQADRVSLTNDSDS